MTKSRVSVRQILQALSSTMPLQAFSFPVPETRFFKAGCFIYKFQIRGGSSYSGEEVLRGNGLNLELEEIIRTVLGNLDNLQPFTSNHFNIFPYKKQWEGMSKMMCTHHERILKAYPFVLILYLEHSGKHERWSWEKEVSPEISVSEPPIKRNRSCSPLEEAILKDLINDLDAEQETPLESFLTPCCEPMKVLTNWREEQKR
ncbi:membrane-anchored junction protein isoform X1 [Antennarius striatus]|uniref:membrane-anchored junction protein isoform X1 n=1 Tax=Antennarius striatus TaxID=241820 RepID=UPI0035B4DEE7